MKDPGISILKHINKLAYIWYSKFSFTMLGKHLLLSTLLLYASQLLAQAPLFRHFTVEDGLPSNNVYFVDQDDLGYIWLTTDRGVSRFNGEGFENFDKENGLGDNDIFSTQVEYSGRRWFLGSNGLPTYFEEDYFVRTRLNKKESISGGILHCMFQLREDSLLFGTKEGLWAYSRNTEELSIAIKEFRNHSVFRAWTTVENQLYLLTNLGIYKIDSTQHIDTIEQFFPNVHFTKSTFDTNGNLYFLMEKAVYVFSSDAHLTKLFDLSFGPISLQLIKQDLWVGTVNGVHRYHQNEGNWNLQEVILPGQRVASIQEDRDEGIWFSTLDNGVFYAAEESIRYYPNLNECKQCRINKLYKTYDNKIWALTHSNFSIRVDQEPFEQMTFNVRFNGGKNVELHQMLETETDTWFFTNGPVIQYMEDDYVKYGPSSVYDYLIDGDALYFATTNGTYRMKWSFLQDSLRRDVYSLIDVANKRVGHVKSNALYRGKNEEVWVGTVDGLYQIKDQVIQQYAHELLPKGTKVTDIKQLGDWMLVSTAGNGLIGIQKDQSIVFTEKLGLSSNFCNRLFVLDSTTIMVGSTKGMDCIKLRTDSLELWPNKQIGTLHINDFAILQDYLYIASHEGLIKLPISLLNKTPSAPQFYLKSIAVNDTVTSLEQTFPYYRNKFRFDFEAVGFNHHNRLNYQYQLKGYQAQWVNSNTSTFELASLSPGTYTLSAKVCIQNSQTCSPVWQHNFTISPSFWNTWWFYSLLVLAFSTLVYLFFRIRILTYNRDVVRELLQLILQKFKQEPTIIIKDIKDGSNTQIFLNEVKWISSNRNYISFFLEKQEIITRAPLKEIEQQLKQTKNNPCIRIHRSYIVNKEAVQAWHSSFVKIGDQQIPVGPAYKEQLDYHFSSRL